MNKQLRCKGECRRWEYIYYKLFYTETFAKELMNARTVTKNVNPWNKRKFCAYKTQVLLQVHPNTTPTSCCFSILHVSRSLQFDLYQLITGLPVVFAQTENV